MTSFNGRRGILAFGAEVNGEMISKLAFWDFDEEQQGWQDLGEQPVSRLTGFGSSLTQVGDSIWLFDYDQATNKGKVKLYYSHFNENISI